MPTLVGQPHSADPASDPSGSLRIVPSLSSKEGKESPAVVTFERALRLGDEYEGKGSAYQLQRARNQVRLPLWPCNTIVGVLIRG